MDSLRVCKDTQIRIDLGIIIKLFSLYSALIVKGSEQGLCKNMW